MVLTACYLINQTSFFILDSQVPSLCDPHYMLYTYTSSGFSLLTLVSSCVLVLTIISQMCLSRLHSIYHWYSSSLCRYIESIYVNFFESEWCRIADMLLMVSLQSKFIIFVSLYMVSGRTPQHNWGLWKKRKKRNRKERFPRVTNYWGGR